MFVPISQSIGKCLSSFSFPRQYTSILLLLLFFLPFQFLIEYNRITYLIKKKISPFLFLRFCVGDRFYLSENKILCEYDWEERLVFANMSYHPSSLAHIRRQVSNLQVRLTFFLDLVFLLSLFGFGKMTKCGKILVELSLAIETALKI